MNSLEGAIQESSHQIRGWFGGINAQSSVVVGRLPRQLQFSTQHKSPAMLPGMQAETLKIGTRWGEMVSNIVWNVCFSSKMIKNQGGRMGKGFPQCFQSAYSPPHWPAT